MKIVALRLPLAWPPGIPTVREADQELEGTQPINFETDRDRLNQLLHEFAKVSDGGVFPEHAIFGRLSRSDWGRWAYRHSDHHLRQFGV